GLDPFLLLAQSRFLDDDGLGHEIGGGRVFPQPLADQLFRLDVRSIAVALDIGESVEEVFDGAFVVWSDHGTLLPCVDTKMGSRPARRNAQRGFWLRIKPMMTATAS